MRISIITVCYNSAATMEDTLNSVALQDYNNIEHIIIDGASSDATIEIVKKFSHISFIVSEKDKGIYDAMNKGISMATGDVIGILNSDDVYINSSVISKVIKQFEDQNTDAVYADLQYVQHSDLNKVTRTWRSGYYSPRKFYFGWMPPHPTFFVRKKVYDSIGDFNCSLKSAADYEFMLRALLKNNINARYLPEVLVKMRTGGMSNATLRHRLRANREDREAWRINNITPYFFTIPFKPLRKVLQFIFK
ncbi:MAG TPA: glycosyltransferase family 2 protein [Flavitalea sp.]|nr:glycosyltransferase family 2 protein [Flavitalea sp.]